MLGNNGLPSPRITPSIQIGFYEELLEALKAEDEYLLKKLQSDVTVCLPYAIRAKALEVINKALEKIKLQDEVAEELFNLKAQNLGSSRWYDRETVDGSVERYYAVNPSVPAKVRYS